MEKSWRVPVAQKLQRHSGGWTIGPVAARSAAKGLMPEISATKTIPPSADLPAGTPAPVIKLETGH
jgi:hypothetical protein